jgi:hypothetical protein
MNGLLGGGLLGSTTSSNISWIDYNHHIQQQLTCTFTGGTTITIAPTPPPESALAWLDRRLNEIRVKL